MPGLPIFFASQRRCAMRFLIVTDVVRFAARPRHGGREQSGARSRPAGASLDNGKRRSPLERRSLFRLRRSHSTVAAPRRVHRLGRNTPLSCSGVAANERTMTVWINVLSVGFRPLPERTPRSPQQYCARSVRLDRAAVPQSGRGQVIEHRTGRRGIEGLAAFVAGEPASDHRARKRRVRKRRIVPPG